MKDDSDNTDEPTSTPTHTVEKVDIAVGRPTPGEDYYRFSITDALRHAGVTDETVNETSLLLRPEQGESNELIAHLISNEYARDGRTNSQWRGIISPDSSETYRISLTTDHLEPLGFDLDNDLPIVNVWAGDGILSFERVDERELPYNINEDVKEIMKEYGLSIQQATYALEEDVDPQKVANEADESTR